MKFRYQALAAGNELEQGLIDALNPQEALRQLQERGLTPVSVAEEQEAKRTGGRLGRAEVIRFFDELVTLLKAGVALIDALESQAENQINPVMDRVLTKLVRGIQQGRQLSDVVGEAKELRLPDYMVQLTAAGEMTGKLAESLERGVQQMQYEDEFNAEIRNALTYPAILVVTGVSAVALVFSLVVPKFANLLDGDAELPWLAESVLRAGMFFNQNGLWILLLAVSLVVFSVVQLSRPSVRIQLFNYIARLPLIGHWLAESESGRWTSVLSALLGSGVPIVKSLELANSGVGIRSRQRRMDLALFAVKGGEPLSQALQQQQSLTPVAYNILRVGEQSGELPAMLASLSRLYEKNSRQRMQRILVLVEPLAILLIGSAIGIIIIGIVLAITSTNNIPI